MERYELITHNHPLSIVLGRLKQDFSNVQIINFHEKTESVSSKIICRALDAPKSCLLANKISNPIHEYNTAYSEM